MAKETSKLWETDTSVNKTISELFVLKELADAIKHLHTKKAVGSERICPELILQAGHAMKSWFGDFFLSCLRRIKIPKIWRRALVVAIPKPSKLPEDPKNYSPIFFALPSLPSSLALN